jgi:hypothetical protein
VVSRRWEPRGGAPLIGRQAPGKIERAAVSAASRVPKLFLHPAVAIVLGALITFAGRGELRLRATGIVLIAIWLAADLWAWVPTKGYGWRFVAGWSGTSVLLIAAMGIMWWWLDAKLEDQEDDVFANLRASVVVPPSGDPYSSKFTVRNGSGSVAIGDRTIECIPILFTDVRGWVLNFRDIFPNGISEVWPSPQAELGPGNAETDPCLIGILIRDWPPSCLDTILDVRYSIVTQPAIARHKRFRFVATSANGQWQWDEQPVDLNGTYCSSFIRRP